MASMTGTEFPGATVPDPTGAVTIGDYLTAFQTVTGLSEWMFYDTDLGTSGTAEAQVYRVAIGHSFCWEVSMAMAHGVLPEQAKAWFSMEPTRQSNDLTWISQSYGSAQ